MMDDHWRCQCHDPFVLDKYVYKFRSYDMFTGFIQTRLTNSKNKSIISTLSGWLQDSFFSIQHSPIISFLNAPVQISLGLPLALSAPPTIILSLHLTGSAISLHLMCPNNLKRSPHSQLKLALTSCRCTQVLSYL